jgi:SAM-dependent methyltransferase
MSLQNYFGESVAARYDEGSPAMFDAAVVRETVDFLAGLAGAGAALELGVGTGRIALPLSERGVRVHGIDLSEAMLSRLRSKPGAERIGLTVGDFSSAKVEGTFTLAYLVYNTINNLTTQDAQVACFENAAAHLEPGGCFVIEVGVPSLRVLAPGRTLHALGVDDGYIGVGEFDTAGQRYVNHHVRLGEDGTFEQVSIPFRYAWPAELDLMARIAGLRLRERWSGWKREPFTHESTKHVSVWERIR